MPASERRVDRRSAPRDQTGTTPGKMPVAAPADLFYLDIEADCDWWAVSPAGATPTVFNLGDLAEAKSTWIARTPPAPGLAEADSALIASTPRAVLEADILGIAREASGASADAISLDVSSDEDENVIVEVSVPVAAREQFRDVRRSFYALVAERLPAERLAGVVVSIRRGN